MQRMRKTWTNPKPQFSTHLNAILQAWIHRYGDARHSGTAGRLPRHTVEVVQLAAQWFGVKVLFLLGCKRLTVNVNHTLIIIIITISHGFSAKWRPTPASSSFASCFSPVLSGSVPANLLRTTPQHHLSTLCVISYHTINTTWPFVCCWDTTHSLTHS